MALNGGAIYKPPAAPHSVFNGGARPPRVQRTIRGPRASIGTPKHLAGTNVGGSLASPIGGAAAPAAAPVPPPPAPPSPPAPVAPPNPLDAQYYNDMGIAQSRANQQIAQLNATGANERAALGENLRLLSQQEPITEQNFTNKANLAGLLYSGNLGRSIGDLQTQFVRQQARMNDTFSQHEAARQAQISGIGEQLGFTDLAARLAAIERASAAAQTAPLTPGAPAPTTAKQPVVTVPKKTGPGRPRNPAKPVKPSPHVQRRGR